MLLFLSHGWKLLLLLTCSCALNNAYSHEGKTIALNRSSFALPTQASPIVGSSDITSPSVGRDDISADRLSRLWTQRTRVASSSDYPIGPGDVVEISVPAMKALRGSTVRVSGDGAIALPLLGVIPVTGLTEENLRQELHRRLEEYMYRPQVKLFVREYRSHQVAVLGAVTKPGFYSVASGADTLRDMLALAGGPNADAAAWICLTPSEETNGELRDDTSLDTSHQRGSGLSSVRTTPNIEPLLIELADGADRNNHQYLTLPARPGDVITVPMRGEVLVHGWVKNPGSYRITPGLTVVGAVTAAGGPLFAAKLDTVKVLRRERGKGDQTIEVDLATIRKGASPDIAVHSGDIVVVSVSGVKAVPYSFYQLIASLVRVGASIPLY